MEADRISISRLGLRKVAYFSFAATSHNKYYAGLAI
jgi:hypothetical protein